MDARKFKQFDGTLAGVRIEEVRTNGPKYWHTNIQKCNMRAEQISYWKHGCNSIRCMVSHNIGGEGLTILSSSQIRVYEQATGNLFHYEEHNDNIGEIAIFGWRNHAIVNRGANEVMTYGYWPLNLRQPERVIKVRGTASWSISGTQNYLVYGSKLDEKVCIVCFSMEGHRTQVQVEPEYTRVVPRAVRERNGVGSQPAGCPCRKFVLRGPTDPATRRIGGHRRVWSTVDSQLPSPGYDHWTVRPDRHE